MRRANKLLRGFSFAVTTVAIYLGVPLLGWGVRDLRGFFAAWPRLGYAAAVGLFALLVGHQAIESPEGIRGRRGKEGKGVHRQSVVSLVMILALYVALFSLPFANRRGIGVMYVGDPLRWAGLLLTFGGLGLIYGSGVALGKMYSKQVTLQQDHQLITDGLYRYIRHPRYLGVLGLSVGFSLLYRSWIALIVVVLLVVVLLVRIRDEERVLHEAFGAEWEAYCQRSWKLLPFIY